LGNLNGRDYLGDLGMHLKIMLNNKIEHKGMAY
jgi:hypothetical protein